MSENTNDPFAKLTDDDRNQAKTILGSGNAARGGVTVLLRADPHRWGVGLVHQIDLEREQILCGRTPANCPGTRFEGSVAEITCKTCLRSIEASRRHAEMMRQWDADTKAREDLQREWWQRYNEYLCSATWRAKRDLVLHRASGACEGCGERRAVQVHHLRYPRDCVPGSAEWTAKEKLFDLTAVCLKCHDDVHGRQR